MAKTKPSAVRRRARPPVNVVAGLTAYFRRNGYVRWQNAERLRTGRASYKKGFEVRLVAESEQELAAIRGLLERAGFRPGAPFVKGGQYRQPLYGKAAVLRFLELVGDDRAQPGVAPDAGG